MGCLPGGSSPGLLNGMSDTSPFSDKSSECQTERELPRILFQPRCLMLGLIMTFYENHHLVVSKGWATLKCKRCHSLSLSSHPHRLKTGHSLDIIVKWPQSVSRTPAAFWLKIQSFFLNCSIFGVEIFVSLCIYHSELPFLKSFRVLTHLYWVRESQALYRILFHLIFYSDMHHHIRFYLKLIFLHFQILYS